MISLIQTKNLKEAKDLITPLPYKKVNVLSWHEKETEYFELCPYVLKTDGLEENITIAGVIFENYWQSAKVFETVYDIEVYPHHSLKGNAKYLSWKYTCKNNTGQQINFDKINNKLTDEYYDWRNSLLLCQKPIRYPNDIHRRHLTLFSLGYTFQNGEYIENRYNYIAARKAIYFKEYIRLIRKLPIYLKLLNEVKSGINILITEVDVPSKNKKGLFSKVVNENNIYNPTLESIEQLLHDPSEAFGHGLCLSYALLQDLK